MNYFAYIKESRGLDSVVGESGFVTFVLHPEECFIEDVYTVPSMRKQGFGTILMDKVVARAREHGCKRLVTTVATRINDPETSLKSCFAYGFKIVSASNDIILLKMEL